MRGTATMSDDIIVGTIRITGVVHGVAINAIITEYAHPEEWFMKQFVSQEQLEAYAADNHLAIQKQE